MALLIGVLLLAGDVWLVWKAAGRNRGVTEQQHVRARHPLER